VAWLWKDRPGVLALSLAELRLHVEHTNRILSEK
jgi:hypothetical protein